MWEKYEPCIQLHRLKESLHEFDTQMNESMNQSISKYAPKNKYLGSSMALTHRVSVAIGIHNLGHFQFWYQVFKKLELHISPSLERYLKTKDEKKEKEREYQSVSEVKRKRNKDKFEKLQAEMKKIKKDSERGATYGAGIAMNSTIPPEVERMDRENKTMNNVQCKLAGCYNNKHVRQSNKT